MKHIQKTVEPTEFTEWKKGVSSDWAPSWGALDGSPIKQVVKNALLDEQGRICCYCGISIRNEDSHIEHFRPRRGPHAWPGGELDYQNLHASCLSDQQDGAKPHCGMKKGDWFDPHLLISPLDPGCEARFGYRADGAMFAQTTGDTAAETTMNRLGLQIEFLNAHRRKAIEASGLFDVLADASADEIQAWADTLMQRGPDGAFTEFCFATAYVLKHYSTAGWMKKNQNDV